MSFILVNPKKTSLSSLLPSEKFTIVLIPFTCITLSTLLTLAVFRTRFTEKRSDGLAHRKVSVLQW